MKILVTGAGGFVGGRLVQRLATAGPTVVALDRVPNGLDGVPDLRRVETDLRIRRYRAGHRFRDSPP